MKNDVDQAHELVRGYLALKGGKRRGFKMGPEEIALVVGISHLIARARDAEAPRPPLSKLPPRRRRG